MKNPVLTIEVNIEHNRNLMFPPLDRPIRGRFELIRVSEPEAMTLRHQVPDFPGQQISINTETREGQIIEPIHRVAALVKIVAANKMRLEDEVVSYPNVDVDAWLFWMKAAVVMGKARIIEGQVPETVNYTPPANSQAPRPLKGEDRKREIFRAHPETALEYLEMTPEKRKAWEQLVGV